MEEGLTPEQLRIFREFNKPFVGLVSTIDNLDLLTRLPLRWVIILGVNQSLWYTSAGVALTLPFKALGLW